jgi:hypothetical protein
MPELHVQLTKCADGGAVLRCIRADGSATWQRHKGRQAAFFPLHDLTHYAVETVLGFRCGFFGLIAEGWGIDETSGKGPGGPLPQEAVLVEHLVGFLDVERATAGAWTAAEYVDQLVLRGLITSDATPAWLTDAALDRVRVRRRELFAEWTKVAPASRLELTFDRSSRVTSRGGCRPTSE